MRSKGLKNKNPALRRKALFSLGQRSFKKLAEVLVKDPSPVIRHEAAFLLGEGKDKRALPVLLQAIKNDASDLVRHEAIEALGDLGVMTKEVKLLLLSLKKDKNPFIRDTARIALLTMEQI